MAEEKTGSAAAQVKTSEAAATAAAAAQPAAAPKAGKIEAMVGIFNANQSGAIHTSRGKLAHQQSLLVPKSEAERLCRYHGVLLASDVVPTTGETATLKAENAKLRSRIAELEKQLADAPSKKAKA